MRIIFHEMKKIFHLKAVLLLLALSFIYYVLFIKFYIDHFPNGRPALDLYRVSIEMVKDYGSRMDEKEFSHFQEVYQQQVKEANRFLQSRPEFAAAGITTYEAFRNMDMSNDTLAQLYSKIMFEENLDLFWELQAREYFIDRYENKEDWIRGRYEDVSHQQEQRLQEVINRGHIDAIFPFLILENYNDLIRHVSILTLLSIVFMISPLYLRDRSNLVVYLQYSSKTGRRIFGKKLVAGLLAAALIITLQLAAFFVVYPLDQVGPFLSAEINSAFNDWTFWYNWTFGQYIALTVIAIYLLGLVVACLTAWISRLATNTLTLIGVQVPISFVLFWLAWKYLMNALTEIGRPPYFLPACYVALIAVAIALVAWRWKKEKEIDLAV